MLKRLIASLIILVLLTEPADASLSLKLGRSGPGGDRYVTWKSGQGLTDLSDKKMQALSLQKDDDEAGCGGGRDGRRRAGLPLSSQRRLDGHRGLGGNAGSSGSEV